MTAPEGDISTFAYNPVGQMTGLTTQRPGSNGVQTANTYDNAHRLTAITHTNATSGTLIQSYDYDLDLAGNRTHVLESDGVNQQEYWWSYDAANRLTSETYPDGGGGSITTTYVYDPVGNRLTETTGGQTTTYTYNNRDQLTQTNGPSGIISYDYDGRGNLWRKVDGMDVTTYSYDARDRLIGANLPDGTSLAYTYDYGRRRVQQTVNGSSTTNYLWDELSPYGDVVAEIDQSNALVASYSLARGRLVAQTRSGVTSYYLPDAQNSTRLLTNLNATVTDTYDYSAFGETIAQTGTTINPYRYTAQQYDNLTNLYYLRARYYTPGLGRFLSRDSWPLDLSNPIEINRYVYAANNPVMYLDPSGYNILVGQAAQDMTALIVAVATVALVAVAVLFFINLWLFVKAQGGIELTWFASEDLQSDSGDPQLPGVSELPDKLRRAVEDYTERLLGNIDDLDIAGELEEAASQARKVVGVAVDRVTGEILEEISGIDGITAQEIADGLEEIIELIQTFAAKT